MTTKTFTADVYLRKYSRWNQTIDDVDTGGKVIETHLLERLNEISTFELRIWPISEDDPHVQEGKIVKLFQGETQFFKGRVEKIEYSSDFGLQTAIVKGYGMAVKLLDRDTDRDTFQYDNTATNTIIPALCNGIINVGTNTNYGDISIRFEYSHRLRAAAAVANAANYDWWVDQDGSDNDQFNIDARRGSAGSVKTYNTSGEDQNATLTTREKDREAVFNDITLLGYGDGFNQISTNFAAVAASFTYLNENLTDSDTTISVIDASELDSPSGEIIIGEERITYTGVSTNDLTGCTRGANSTTAKSHPKNAYVQKYFSKDSPESGSSMHSDNYGRRSRTYSAKEIIDEDFLQLMCTRKLVDQKDLIERIVIYPTDPTDITTVGIGDNITINDTNTGLSTEKRVISRELTIKWMEGIEELRLECSNKKPDFLEQIDKLRKETDTLNAYMQGATTVFNVSSYENCDVGYPLNLRFRLPDDVKAINRVLLSYKILNYRAYTNTSESNSATTVTGESSASAGTTNLNGHTWVDLDDYTFTTDIAGANFYGTIRNHEAPEAGEWVLIRVNNVTDSKNYPNSQVYWLELSQNGESCFAIHAAENLNGKQCKIQVSSSDSGSTMSIKYATATDSYSRHTHNMVYNIYEHTGGGEPLEDFENISDWTLEDSAGGTGTIQSVTSITGNALKVTMNGTSSFEKWILSKAFTETHFAIYVRTNDPFQNHWYFIIQDDAGNQIAKILQTKDSALTYFDSTGSHAFTGTFSANTWYVLEVEKVDSTHQNVYWGNEDGTLIDKALNITNIGNTAWTSTNKVQLYHDDQTGVSTDIYWDELGSGIIQQVSIEIGEDGSEILYKANQGALTDEDITAEIQAVGAGHWVNIKFNPNTPCRLEANAYIKCFIQSK